MKKVPGTRSHRSWVLTGHDQAEDFTGRNRVVLDGQTGTLVPVRNAAALAEAIEEMLERRGDWAALGSRDRAHIVETLNSRSVIDRLCEFYAKVATRLAQATD